MKSKDFLIGILIIIVFSVIFVLPSGSLGLLIPSILFASMAGGFYVGYQRKRPLISCFYDGFKLGFFAGIIQAAIILPILWFMHNQRYEISTPIQFILIVGTSCMILGGLVGAPFGGLTMGLFYRYLSKDRGETELYDSYIDQKSENRNMQDLMD